MTIGIGPATFGPAYNREPAQPHLVQPRAHLTGGEIHIGFGPFAGLGIFVTIKLCRSHPVRHRKVAAILDPHAALLWCVHHEQPTQRPMCLAAKVLWALLIHDDDRLAAVPQLGGCDQSGQSAADNNCVCAFHTRTLSRFLSARQGRSAGWLFLFARKGRRPFEISCFAQSGQNTRMAGIDTAITIISKGKPMRQ